MLYFWPRRPVFIAWVGRLSPKGQLRGGLWRGLWSPLVPEVGVSIMYFGFTALFYTGFFSGLHFWGALLLFCAVLGCFRGHGLSPAYLPYLPYLWGRGRGWKGGRARTRTQPPKFIFVNTVEFRSHLNFPIIIDGYNPSPTILKGRIKGKSTLYFKLPIPFPMLL